MNATMNPDEEMAFVNDLPEGALVDLQGARLFLSRAWSEDQVRALLDLGPNDPRRIEWAWDIAGAEAFYGEGKREIRLLASCVPIAQRARRRPFDVVVEEIFSEVLPPEPAVRRFLTIKSTDLARAFACTATHILNLIEDESLEAVEATVGKVGRNSAPAVTWPSIVAFLKARKL